MALRPTWRGHLKLSLVTCPVALYTATSAAGDVHFNLINPATNNRIRMITTDPDTGPVERGSLVKGFEVEKGQYVLLSDEEIRSVRLESTKTLDIERFVPEAEIDRTYWDHPYFLAPDGKIGQEAYAVIREAMRASGQIALGRVVLSTRERLLALEPHGEGLMAWSLRSAAEVKDAREAFAEVESVTPDPAMLSIAQAIIDQRKGPFDPSGFVDRYEEALKALIAEKTAGRVPVGTAPEPDDTNVIDLMAALRASLQRGSAPAPAAPKTAAKPAAKAKAGQTKAEPSKPAPAKRAAKTPAASAAAPEPVAAPARARKRAG